jgi:hypothetical protein
MRKRYVVLGLSAFLALALSVPALGGPTNPVASISASVKSIANKALKKAKAAQATANSALAAANGAQTTANNALSKANSASTEAKAAQKTANEAKTIGTEAKTIGTEAKTTANTALTKANTALTTAESKLRTTEFVAGAVTTEDTSTPKSTAVECPAGTQVTGGTFAIGGESNKVTPTAQSGAFYGPGWLVTARAISGFTPTWSLQAIAVCARP